jgi:transposase-like protein
MPWLETVPMDERLQFVQDGVSDRFTMSELCARYGVSRRIGYQWLARYAEEGRRGLQIAAGHPSLPASDQRYDHGAVLYRTA